MAGLNQCNFIGRIGQDPEIRYTAVGMAVANFSIAVREKRKGEEVTEWVRVVAFDKLAGIIEQYVKKGSMVFISGKMQTRKWEDNQGVTKYSTEILANTMQMLDSRPDSGQQPAPHKTAAPTQQPPSPGSYDVFDDDIPF